MASSASHLRMRPKCTKSTSHFDFTKNDDDWSSSRRMTMKSSLLLLLLACSTPNLGNALAQYSGFNLTNATLSSTLSSTNLVTNYTCTLYNLWTQSRQPASYPPNPSFFSPLLVAHSNAYTLWASGSTATQGLNSMVLVRAAWRIDNMTSLAFVKRLFCA
jgi:hypothetical protein